MPDSMLMIQKKSKGSYQHGNLRESLIKAAFFAIKKNHRMEFSLRELAKSVGVTPMAAYRHFPAKEAILLALASEGFMKLGHAFEESLKSNPSDLQAIGKAYVEFAVKNPVYFQVMFHPDLNEKNGKHEARPEDRRAFQILLDCVALNQKLGIFKNPDTHAIAIAAWSTVHGLSCLLVNGNIESKYFLDSDALEKLIEQTTALAITGYKSVHRD